MEYYTSFNKDYAFKVIKNNKKALVCDDIFTLDTEVSSGFLDIPHINPFTGEAPIIPWSKDVEYIKELPKRAWMYIWMLGVNDTIYYGRTIEELREFLALLQELCPYHKYFYIHNLSYDTQILLNLLPLDQIDMFARKPRTPMKVTISLYDMEIRCSYLLTQLSLDNCAKQFKCDHKKLVGNLDYNLLISPTDKLTKEQLDYCENDCLVMYDFLKVFRDRYQTMANIPLTQTGIARREIQHIYKGDIGFLKKMQGMNPGNVDQYLILDKVFWGGITHNNALYNNKVITNGHSKDESSAYPGAMLQFAGYPMEQFVRTRKRTFDFEHKRYLIHVRWYDLESNLFNTYIPMSKCEDISCPVNDNGRLARAAICDIWVTDIDYQIIKESYTIGTEEILEVWVCNKVGYLDSRYLQYVLDLYSDKTTLKGIDDDYTQAIYLNKKKILNSLYGVEVTRTVSPEIELEGEDADTGEKIVWPAPEEMQYDFIKDKLLKQKKSWKCFFSFAHGVFITAVARWQLWQIVKKIDSDIFYMDTDSIKYIGDHEDVFKEYNRMITNKIHLSCEINGLDFSKSHPADIKGKEHPIGIYDTEPDYKQFKSLGAKKYCYTDEDDKIHITVSGVSKKASTAINNINEFTDGFIFDEAHTGKLLQTYIDEQEPFKLWDGTVINQKYAVHMMPTTYLLKRKQSYIDYVSSLQMIGYYLADDNSFLYD